MDLSALEQISLIDSKDKPARLGSFWVDRRVVLVFTRHFG